GSYTFTPDANWNGAVPTATYTTNTGASDTLDITVTPVDDAPTIVLDTYSVIEGSTLNATSVLANDSDAEGDAISVVSVASDANGLNEQVVDGSSTFTTALGGTVVMNSDGTFTYTAPVLNHTTDGQVEQDYLYYKASDGASDSVWQKIELNVGDTAPTALDDSDSVGFGGTADGNVINGDGGNDVQADTLGEDATSIISVTYNGTTYNTFDGNGNIVIDTDNGTLTLNQDGTYSYDSAYAIGSVSGTNQADWDSAKIDYYGINSGDPFDANGNLDLSLLTASNAANVNFDDNSGLGVNGGSSDTKVDGNEYLVFDVNGKTSTATLELSNFGNNENVDWYAYNELGELVGSGTKRGNGNDTLDVVSNQTPANGSDFIRYIVIDPASNSEIRVDSLSYNVDSTLSISDTFTYELQDADGDSSSADFTVNHDATIVGVDDSATVYESALANGTDASSDAEVTTGNLFTNDLGIGSSATVDSINGTSASNGVITVNTSNGTLVVDAATGDYTYTLTSSNLNGDNVVESFTYNITDATGQSASAQLNVNIVDDAPIGSDVVQNIQDTSASAQTTNLIIVLDRSGSMAWDLEGDAAGDANFNADQVRMDIAKEALKSMFDSYDDLGNVNIKFVDFSDNVNESAWYVDDKQNANLYLDNITPNGGTYYDDALNATMNGYNPPAADKTLVYFISDGEPNSGHEVDAALQTDWENFLTNNNVDISFGIGITESVNLDSLTPIAYPDTNANGDTEPYAVQVLDALDLKQTLLDTVSEGIVQGDASIVSGSADTGIILGADGGHIDTVVVDGVSYVYDANNAQQSITTNRGGVLDIDFNTGEYIYTINPNDTVSNEQEIFTITAIDGDGDTKSIDLTINLDYVANIDANVDNIITNATDGSSVSVAYDALIHNDTLSSDMKVTNVVADNGTDINSDNTGITFTDIANGEAVTYTISNTDASVTDSAKANVTLQNSDSIRGTAYDDIIIANRQNSNNAATHIVLATVLSGSTYNQDNQIGFEFQRSFNGSAINSITFTLPQGYFDTSGSGSTAPSIGASTVGIDSSDVTFDAPDGSQTLTVNFAQNSFSEGDAFWFGVDTDYISGSAGDTGEDFGLQGVNVTINYSDGTSQTGTYQANADGTSSLLLDDGNSLIGDAGDDTLIGNENSELLDGGAGDDMISAGGGDDMIVYDIHDSLLDGGSGNDTLILNANDSIDFGNIDTLNNTIMNIEKIDLSQGDHILDNLSLDDVLDMTDTNNTLEITGDAADQVNVDTTGWTQESAVDDGTSTTYTYSNDATSDSITLIVDDNIQNTGL
ncbi:Ig-like domain-containing protein, partial [Sulfurimonas sp. NWX79]|uniref:beta strand repeat-containing protein n=2 Tax=Sulfurimonas TaxID=202746 RepID=UPI003204C76C